MKKRIAILLCAILLLVGAMVTAIVASAEDAEAQDTITISYMNTQDTTSDTTSLDKTAYSDGKQTVAVGEKFTLPTTSSNSYAGKEGFQLVWYTVDGRTYKAGEEVSFNKDTKLFRAVSKECYTMAEVNYAMKNESKSAILMADIDSDIGIGVENRGQSVLILNGFTVNITKNGTAMGEQRSGKHIYGTGVINVTNPDGKIGSYCFFSMQSHGYDGVQNKQVIGRDVILNAPPFYMGADGDGSYNNHFPWMRIYGTVNCYSLVSITSSNNRAPFVEIYETANVTINGPRLLWDVASNKFNNQALDLRIYGGTFNLPAEAATEGFWSNDNLETFTSSDGKTTYTNVGLNKNNKDIIKIFGGTFNVAGGEAPAIAPYLTGDYLATVPSGGNGLITNNNDSTYHVCYMNRPGYKLVFSKYTEGTPAKLVVTDEVDGSLSGTYYYTLVVGVIEGTTTATIDKITVYEDEAGTIVTDKFELGFAMSSCVTFSNAITKADYKLQAQDDSYLVVPAGCEHDYVETVVEATCQTQGTVTYTCKKCAHSMTTITEEKGAHAYEVVNHIEASLSSLGSKTFECADCGETIVRPYTVDPTELEIAVTIRNDDNTFEDITVIANEIFNFAVSGVEGTRVYTLTGIKAFGDYKIRNIYGVTIPKGILYVNISTQNYESYEKVEYGVAVLTVADGAKVDILNIGNLRRLEKIVIGKNTDIVFGASCSWYSPNNEQRKPNIISEIDMSAGNHTVKFVSACFEGRETIKSLKLGENASYSFGYRTFYNGAIEELVFPATSTYEFAGTYAFYGNDMTSIAFPDGVDFNFAQSTFENCTKLENVTFGENANYNIGSYTFLYSAMEKVVFAPNSTYTVATQAFINEKLTELDMSAGNMTVTLNNSAFNCWLSSKQYCVLSTIKFGESSTYTIGESSLNDTAITSLVLAPNSSYTFKRYCINGSTNKTTFAEIDASADNVTVVFEADSIRDRNAVSVLKINGKNSSYHFNGSSFYNTTVSELVMGEGSTYIFEANCFNGSTPMAKIDASANGVNVNFKQNAFNGKTAIAELLINGENATYSFGAESFKSVAVKSLKLGAGSTYTFARYTFSSCKVESLDATAPNVTATFEAEAFRNMSVLTYLAFGENSTYVFGNHAFNGTNPTNDVVFYASTVCSFGQESFRDTDFATVKFENGINATFAGTNAFLNCLATELYLGSGMEIGNYPFKNFKYLEKLVIMEGVTFSNEYFFENAGSADFSTPFVVYNHSYDLVYSKGMFNNCDGVVFYTVTDDIGTRTDVFANCSDGTGYKGWTVVLGIPHVLTESQADPTCTVQGGTIWVAADCDCGIIYREELNINVYENKSNIKEDTAVARVDNYPIAPIPALGHLQGEFVTIVYPNGYLATGSAQYNCERCMNGEGYYERVTDALIVCLGYSVSQFGDTMAITQGYRINVEAYEEYKDVCTSLTYGVVAKGNVNGEEIAPLAVNEGVITPSTGTYYANLAEVVDNYFEIKVKGITAATVDNVIAFCAYIYDGASMSYVDNGQIGATVVGTSYTSALA